MKIIKQNSGLIVIIIISIVISYFTSFILTPTETIYERTSGLFEGLIGLIIASYAIFISFIPKLKNKIGDKSVLNTLNYYFLINIGLLFLANGFIIIYPALLLKDLFIYRLFYFLTLGFTILTIQYLFLSAKQFIK